MQVVSGMLCDPAGRFPFLRLMATSRIRKPLARKLARWLSGLATGQLRSRATEE